MGRSCQRVSVCSLKRMKLTGNSELTVKIVNIPNMDQVIRLREQKKPVKHLSYDPSGTHLAVSCSDGLVYLYLLTTETPLLVKTIDGLIRGLETDVEASSEIAWHPDGRAFAAATATRGTNSYMTCGTRLRYSKRHPSHVNQ
jgi:chromosome transmission fidelity protein 4